MTHADFLVGLERNNLRFRLDRMGSILWALSNGKAWERVRIVLSVVALACVFAFCLDSISAQPQRLTYALFGVLVGFTYLGFVAEFGAYAGLLVIVNKDRLWFVLPPQFADIVVCCCVPAALIFNLWFKAEGSLRKAVQESSGTYDDALAAGRIYLMPYPD